MSALRKAGATIPSTTQIGGYGSPLSRGRHRDITHLRDPLARNDGLRIGCLKTETISSSRTSERSERDPGPITTDVCVGQSWSHNPIDNSDRWLWVPAFAGTTSRHYALARPVGSQ